MLFYSLSMVKIRIKTTIPGKNMIDLYKTQKTKLAFIAVHKCKEKLKISTLTC